MHLLHEAGHPYIPAPLPALDRCDTSAATATHRADPCHRRRPPVTRSHAVSESAHPLSSPTPPAGKSKRGRRAARFAFISITPPDLRSTWPIDAPSAHSVSYILRLSHPIPPASPRHKRAHMAQLSWNDIFECALPSSLPPPPTHPPPSSFSSLDDSSPSSPDPVLHDKVSAPVASRRVC